MNITCEIVNKQKKQSDFHVLGDINCKWIMPNVFDNFKFGIGRENNRGTVQRTIRLKLN